MELPSAPILVDGDATRLVQVFANILNNAVKFTPRGGHIWFTAEQQSDEAVVRIRDTGIGIAPDVLPRVFDMFQQAEPILERSTGGLGIGLTLARRLVEMHDGRIDIRSRGPGQGTEVEIRLPIATATDATGRPEAAPRAPGATRSLRVLIVDDNLDAAEMLDVAGVRPGPHHQAGARRRHRRRAAAEFAPDVILLDIGLPVMNGYAVARTLASAAGVHSRPHRRGHRLGPGRGSSAGARSRLRQPLHQAPVAYRPGRFAEQAWSARAVGGSHGHGANQANRLGQHILNCREGWPKP